MKFSEIVQLTIAQFEETFSPMPQLLTLVPFTGHLEIMNRCRTDEERIFYMLYASHQRLKTEELRRCIVNQTYSSLIEKEKMLSPKMFAEYQRKLIPLEVMRKSLEEYCTFLKGNQ